MLFRVSMWINRPANHLKHKVGVIEQSLDMLLFCIPLTCIKQTQKNIMSCSLHKAIMIITQQYKRKYSRTRGRKVIQLQTPARHCIPCKVCHLHIMWPSDYNCYLCDEWSVSGCLWLREISFMCCVLLLVFPLGELLNIPQYRWLNIHCMVKSMWTLEYCSRMWSRNMWHGGVNL